MATTMAATAASTALPPDRAICKPARTDAEDGAAMAQVMSQFCRAAAYLLGMGDLQCPARIYVAAALAARDNGERLRHERIAAVYEMVRPVDAVRDTLEEIADRHRGEAVLVVGETDLVSGALRGLVAGWPARAWSDADEVLALEADADGWRVVGP